MADEAKTTFSAYGDTALPRVVRDVRMERVREAIRGEAMVHPADLWACPECGHQAFFVRFNDPRFCPSCPMHDRHKQDEPHDR